MQEIKIDEIMKLCDFYKSLKFLYVLFSKTQSEGFSAYKRSLRKFDNFYSYKCNFYPDLKHLLDSTSSARKRLVLQFQYISYKEDLDINFISKVAAEFLQMYSRLERATLEALSVSRGQFRNDSKILDEIDEAIHFNP
ncbi:hypothetical protein JXM83_03890 [Candidatus Woesearchaeota archaeon]|nr:hypothetical protein [Candidatus Woesearchaeota archaeon]